MDTGLSHLTAALDRPNITVYRPTKNTGLIGGYGKNQMVSGLRGMSCLNLTAENALSDIEGTAMI
ncbi:glycosyltransferase family 9 protein [Shigella flexneri]